MKIIILERSNPQVEVSYDTSTSDFFPPTLPIDFGWVVP